MMPNGGSPKPDEDAVGEAGEKKINNIKKMTTDNHSESPTSDLPESTREIAGRATGAAREATETTKESARRATDTAREMYHSAASKAGDTLATSKEYVRRNPVPVVLGAIAFGAAIGYTVMMARRKQTFGERYVDEPMAAVRELVLGAFAPVTQRVHKGYDSARDGAGKAMDRVHRLGSGRVGNSLSHQFGRIGNNLKFW